MPTTTAAVRDDVTKKASKPTTTANAKELSSLKQEVAELKGEIAALKRRSVPNAPSAPAVNTASAAPDQEVIRLLRDLACQILARDLEIGRSSKNLFTEYRSFLEGGPL